MANFEGALKYKEAWTNEIARRRANRLSPPHQLPHPDDIKLDFATLEVTIAGPMTKEEKVLWDRWREIRDAMNDEVEELRACYGDDPEFLQVLEVAKQALVGPNLALGGSRRVMQFLESLDRTKIDQAMQSRSKRRRADRRSVTAAVYLAVHAEFVKRTTYPRFRAPASSDGS